MQNRKKIAVAGATGRVGKHIAEVLEERGHEVVAISRSRGVDVITGKGLADALAGAEQIIDAATGPSPEEKAATEFFTTAARNLQEQGKKAGVKRIVMVSIIGTDKFTSGYGKGKIAHERVTLGGPVPATILRAAQFHEFVPQIMEWGKKGDVCYVPTMRIQPVAARAVAEALADLVANPAAAGAILEVAGPRAENLVDLAQKLVAKRGDKLRIEAVSPEEDRELMEKGGLLPGPKAILAGPTFEEWLKTNA
jgi:uncharacterized protein YbjT (DUF2867 family)